MSWPLNSPAEAYLMVEVKRSRFAALDYFDCDGAAVVAVDDEVVADDAGRFVRSRLIEIHSDGDQCLLKRKPTIP